MEILSLRDAKILGAEFYFTGKPCNRGNIAKKRTSNQQCCCADCFELRRVNAAKKYHDNPEACRARRRDYYQRNQDLEIERAKEYRAANPGYSSAQNKAWREKNPQAVIDHNKSYRANNLEAQREYSREYAKKNRARIRAGIARRRAARKQRTPSWFSEFDTLVIAEAYLLAEARSKITGVEFHVDHMIPLQGETASGLHCAYNLQVMPAFMNMTKGNRMQLTEPFEWMAKIHSI